MSWIPGWDSIISANSWSNFYFWAGIAALLSLGVFEVFSHRYSERKDELVTQQQDETQRQHDEEIARLHLETSQANERAAQLTLDLEKERQKTAPRPWTKEQFDAIQSMKGKIPAVAVTSQKTCIECALLANHLITAFHEAGAEIYEDPTLEFAQGTGIFVYLSPNVHNLVDDPVFVALQKAGLAPSSLRMNEQFAALFSIRTDIPIVVVGERFPQYSEFPYFPPKGGSFTLRSLKK